MPFSISDCNRILILLEQPQSQLERLNDCLKRTEAVSEDLVVRVLALATGIEDMEEAIATASTDDAGLIKAGELEWSPNKACCMEKRKEKLQYRLAKIIGFPWRSQVENIF